MTLRQNQTIEIDLTNLVATANNYKICITGNYNQVYYYEGLLSINLSTNRFNIISIKDNGFNVISNEPYKISITYTQSQSNYSISILEN